MKQLFAQLKSEFLSEYRSWSETMGLLVFTWVIAYIIFRLRPDLSLPQFNFVIWIVFMMIALNVALKGANHIQQKARGYLYSLMSPSIIFTAQIIFNLFYLFIATCAFYFSMILFYYPQVHFSWSYLGLLGMASVGVCAVLSFVGAISRHVQGQNTILSILALPLLIPVMILIYQMGAEMLINNPVPESKYIALIGISLLGISLSLLLFPFIWKD